MIEALGIVEGVSGHTTAKVTAGHGIIYSELRKKFGEDGARTYAASNAAALEYMAVLVESENIDCEWVRKDNYIYAETDAELQTVQQEAEASTAAGLAAEFVTDTPLPWDVAGRGAPASPGPVPSAQVPAAPRWIDRR